MFTLLATVSLVEVVIPILVVGILLWVVNSYIPLDGNVKKVLNAVVLIVVIVWLLHAFGAWEYIKGIRA